MAIKVYGYKTGCPACDLLKQLLITHSIPFKFIEMTKGAHPFKTVPQVFNPGGSWIGDYNTMKKDLENA